MDSVKSAAGLPPITSREADRWFAIARVSEEAGRLFYGLREDLDEIDHKAHEEIARLEQTPMKLGDSAMRIAQMMAIVNAARAQAIAKCAEVAAAIAKLGTQLGFGGESQGSGGTGGNGSAPAQSDDPMANRGFGGSEGGRGGPRGPA